MLEISAVDHQVLGEDEAYQPTLIPWLFINATKSTVCFICQDKAYIIKFPAAGKRLWRREVLSKRKRQKNLGARYGNVQHHKKLESTLLQRNNRCPG